MAGQKDNRSQAALHRGLSQGFAGFAVVVGCVALVGWALDIAVLKSILPGWVSMKPNAALAFVLIGIAMLLPSLLPATLNPKLSHLLSLLARLCGLLAGLIGLLTLSEYVFGWNLGIDQWLFREAPGAVGTSYPGRMAPDTALCFLMLAVGLSVARGSPKTERTLFASAVLGWLVTILALAQILTYFTPSIGAYGWWGLTIMAVPTAAAFVVLGAAIVLSAWQESVSLWGLSGRTTAAFACGLSLVVFIGLNTSRSVSRMAETDRRITHAEQVLQATTSVLAEVAKAQTHTRGYVITGDERYLKSRTAADAHCREDLATLRRLTAADPQRQQQSARLEMQVSEALQWFPQVIEGRRTGFADAARRRMVNHGEDLMDNLRATIEQMENAARQLFQEHQRESETMSHFTHTVIVTGTVLSLIVFLFALVGLNRAAIERQQAAEALRGSEERLRVGLNTANIAVFNQGTDLRYVWMYQPQLDYTSEQVMGHTDAELLPPEAAKQVTEIKRRVLDGGLKERAEVPVTVGGQTFIYDLIAEPLRDAGGVIIGLTGATLDITGRKQAEAALSESEAKFRTVFGSAGDGMFVLDLESRKFVMSNAACSRMLGFTPEEFRNLGVPDLHLQEDLPFISEQIEKFFKGEESVRGDVRFKRRDGSTFFTDLNSALIPLGDRKGVLVAFRDITDRKRVEENLRRTATVVRDSNDAITIQDFEGRITAWNRGAELMYGYSEEEALLANIERLTAPDKVEEQKDFVRRLVAGEAITAFETQRVTKDGRVLDVWMTVTKLLDDAGQPMGLASTERDITERKRTEVEIRTLNADLEQRVVQRTAQLEISNKELEAFAYSVSHDLRAPLRAIDGFSCIIVEDYADKMDAEGIRLLNVVGASAQKMDQLITDLLTLSRVTRRKVQPSRIDMTVMVQSIYNEIAPPEVQERFEFSLTPLPEAAGDPILIRQAWTNLLSNAIKFTMPRDERRIEIGGRAENGTNVYSVKDSGVGFNPKYTHKLFGTFQRLHKTEEFDGTGIGLAIVRRVIHRHGGRVWAEGQVNQGATFYFALQGG